MPSPRVPISSFADRDVQPAGAWAVARVGDGSFTAVDRVCRHQFADLSRGRLDADGCLVCPWHGSRYDLSSGRMVEGPQGFLGVHTPTPRYARVVRALGRALPLRRRRAQVQGTQVVLG